VVSLRLGHLGVLTVHRTVIHCARAASLPRPTHVPKNMLYHEYCGRAQRPAPTTVTQIEECRGGVSPPKKAPLQGELSQPTDLTEGLRLYNWVPTPQSFAAQTPAPLAGEPRTRDVGTLSPAARELSQRESQGLSSPLCCPALLCSARRQILRIFGAKRHFCEAFFIDRAHKMY
jgi:hypothetical protein